VPAPELTDQVKGATPPSAPVLLNSRPLASRGNVPEVVTDICGLTTRSDFRRCVHLRVGHGNCEVVLPAVVGLPEIAPEELKLNPAGKY